MDHGQQGHRQGLITLTLCDHLACVDAELTILKCQEMTHTPRRSPFSAKHQAIALSISKFSNTIQVLIQPLLVHMPHVGEISKEKAPAAARSGREFSYAKMGPDRKRKACFAPAQSHSMEMLWAWVSSGSVGERSCSPQ